MEETFFRILIIGDSGVGKSSILLRFTQDTYTPALDLTIGVDFATKTIQILNKQIKLQIWDTAGQEGFRSITRSFYRNADGIFLVFNVAKRSSFENCESWLKEIKTHSPVEVLIYLLGNQCDMVDSRQVSQEEALKFVELHKLNGYIETSAKEAIRVNDAFHDFSQKLYEKFGAKSTESGGKKFQVSLTVPPAKKKKCCGR